MFYDFLMTQFLFFVVNNYCFKLISYLFQIKLWVATCQQSKNETRIHMLELPTLQLAVLKYRYENYLNSSVILIWRLDCCYCRNTFEKIIKYEFIDILFVVVTHPSFNFLKHIFLVFCKYLIVGWQSRALDLPKKPLKLGTQKEKLFVGLCSTYLVCTTILSKVLI